MNKIQFLMRQIIQFIKHYPVTTLLILGIWIICLIPIPETPLSHVKLIDKWTHVTLYTILGCCIWIETARSRQKRSDKQLFLLTFAAPIIMGGLIEIVQATCTGGNRSGEWMDFLADGIGVVLSLLIGILLATCLSKRKRDS